MNKNVRDNNDFQMRLQELRDRYTEGLPEKIAAINANRKKLDRQWDWNLAALLHQMVHSLAGSGGSFGYAQLGTQAREIEVELKAIIDTKAIPAANVWAEIAANISNLQSAIVTPPAKEKDDSFYTNSALNELQKSIYLLEGDREAAEDLRLQLDRFGYEVSSFRTVEALNKAIHKWKPLALIADVVLSDDTLAGIKAVHEIRALYGEAFPILFLSLRNDFEIRLEAVRAGGDAYFVKPVEIAPFVDHLDKLTQSCSSEPYRVLIVDDDQNLAAHYALILNQAGMKVTAISDPRELLKTIANCRPELILMDIYMPICSGVELAKMIRQQEAYIGIPIVFLSSENDEAKQFAAMRMGGDGFLAKPISNRCLIESVNMHAMRSRVLNNMMMQDGLTRLLKHTKIKERLVVEVSRAERSGAEMAYAMIDIDQFKLVNDTYGHLMGDYVIKGLARLLKHRLRKSDVVGRYGGEEFAVILPNCTLDAAIAIIDQIRVNFEKLRFTHDGQVFSVTFSAGVAACSDYPNAQQLTQSADDALYQAKADGRNCVVKAKPKKELAPDE